MSFSASRIVLIAAVIYLVIFFALVSGLINAILEGPRTPRGASFVIPSRSVQTLGETIVTTIILFMGMAWSFSTLQVRTGVNYKNSGDIACSRFWHSFDIIDIRSYVSKY